MKKAESSSAFLLFDVVRYSPGRYLIRGARLPAGRVDLRVDVTLPQRLRGCFRLTGPNVNQAALPSAIRELDDPADLREQRIVLTAPDVVAGVKARAALANQDRSAADRLAREALHAETLRVRIATIARTA